MAKDKSADLRENIKQDLLDQLKRNGTIGKYYVDLVGDYMHLWNVKNLLIEDIKARGVSVTTVSAQGNENIKKNDSVTDLLKTNAQMLKILNELGIKPSQSGGVPDDM